MRRILLSCIAVSASFLSHAQSISPSTVNSLGGSFSPPTSYNRMDWSVGEMVLVNTMQNAGNSGFYVISNGLLQPYVNTPGSIDNSSKFTADEIKVFPNPAVKYFEVDLMTKQKGTFHLSLYNNLGQRIFYKTFYTYGLDRFERIKTDWLSAGTYRLYIELDADAGSVSKKGAYTILKVY